MRKLINLVSGVSKLTEAEDPKTKTKTKAASPAADLNFDGGKSKGAVGAAKRNQTPTTAEPPMGNRARRGEKPTMKPINDPRAGKWLSDLSMSDLGLDDDEEDMDTVDTNGVPTEAYQEPRTPENLPAVISDAMTTRGNGEFTPAFNPKWYMVNQLPGYMQRPIRALGKMIFEPMTDTPLGDIQILSTLTSPEAEVKMMAAWIIENGVKDDESTMNFDQIMPGYSAQTQIWSVEGYQFLIVKDFAGYYIYGWPGGRGVHVDNGMGTPPKQLR